MAHHQGMSLLAFSICCMTTLCSAGSTPTPLVQSTELLLHEMPVSRTVLKARLKEEG